MQLSKLSPFVARGVLAAGLALSAIVAQAQYVWIERPGPGPAVVQSGELDGERASTTTLAGVEVRAGGDVKPELIPDADRLLILGLDGGGDVRVRAHEVLSDGVLMYYHTRWGRSETRAELDFELVPTEPGGNTFQLMWMGAAARASYVRVTTSEGWTRTLEAAEDGTVSLTTPFPGLYVLHLVAKANGWAEVDGKRYEDVRHTSTLSFSVAP